MAHHNYSLRRTALSSFILLSAFACQRTDAPRGEGTNDTRTTGTSPPASSSDSPAGVDQPSGTGPHHVPSSTQDSIGSDAVERTSGREATGTSPSNMGGGGSSSTGATGSQGRSTQSGYELDEMNTSNGGTGGGKGNTAGTGGGSGTSP